MRRSSPPSGKACSARLRVDANAGWSRAQAAELIPRLAQYDLEFIEQPLPAGDLTGLRWLKQSTAGGADPDLCG